MKSIIANSKIQLAKKLALKGIAYQKKTDGEGIGLMYGKTQMNKQGRKGRINNEVRKLKGRR